jgi:dihydroorotate dehydrogenase electron transfer subunit
MSTAALARATLVQRSAPMDGGVELTLRHVEASRAAQPGQFFQIGVQAPGTLLRRPYSVATIDAEDGRLGFIFSVVGAGSAWLASLQASQAVDLIGPLGQGFEPSARLRPVCIGGGLGIAPFPALVDRLVSQGRRPLVVQGARTAGRLLPDHRFAEAEVLVATDDGSKGWHGPVTELLRSLAASDQEWFVCGPTAMLQAVIRLADAVALPRSRVQVALETPMGCGMGTCLGCVTPAVGGGYLLTCQEGPCVRADRVDWTLVADAFHG